MSIDKERVISDYKEYREKLREIYDSEGEITSHQEKMAYFYRGAMTVLAEYREDLEKSEGAYH